jgi:hypothetical protein
LALVVVLAALLPGLAPGAGLHPRLSLAGESPLMVTGSNFKAHERVVVTLTVRTSRFVRTVNATGAGAFVARWKGSLTPVKIGCLFAHVHAVGDRGSVASYKSAGLECAKPTTDPSE